MDLAAPIHTIVGTGLRRRAALPTNPRLHFKLARGLTRRPRFSMVSRSLLQHPLSRERSSSRCPATPDGPRGGRQSRDGGAMTDQNFLQQVKRGVAAAEQSNTLEGLFHLENAALLGTSPILASYLGYCLARERHQFKKGAGLCLEALKEEPQQPIHYLNLARVYLAAGEKARAIKTLRQGLKMGRNRLILEELKKLGIRKLPVFRSLSRAHPLNKHVGLLFTRLGMR